MMPSIESTEQLRNEPLSSTLRPSPLSAALVHRCNPFRFSVRRPSSSDGVSQNEEAAAVFARKPFLRRRTVLLPAAQEAVCDQPVELRVSGDRPLSAKRDSPLLFEKAYHFVSKQMRTVWTCEWQFSASPSPAAACHGRNTFVQKRTVRREKCNIVYIHFLSASCVSRAAPIFYGASPSFRLPCLYLFAFLVREPRFVALPRVGCSPLCCRLEAQSHRVEECVGPIHRVIHVYSRGYVQRRTGDVGEAALISSAACTFLSTESPRVATLGLLKVKYPAVTSSLLLVLYILIRRGEGKRFSSPAGVRRQLAPPSSCLLARVDVLSKAGVQGVSPSVVWVGKDAVARIVFKAKTNCCSCSSAAAGPPSDGCMRGVTQKKRDAPCGLPALWSNLFVRLENRDINQCKSGHVTSPCLLFLSAILNVAVYGPTPTTWVSLSRLLGLRSAVVSHSSSLALFSHPMLLLCSLCCIRDAIVYAVERPLAAAVASSICLMPHSSERRLTPISEVKCAFLSLLCSTKMGRARGRRKKPVKQNAAFLSFFSPTACTGRAAVLLSVILGYLSLSAAPPHQFFSCRYYLFLAVVVSVLMMLLQRSVTLLVTPRPCYSCEAAGVFAIAWIDTQQRTEVTHEQWLGQIPLHYAWRLKNIQKQERKRGTCSSHSSHSEPYAYVCIPAKDKLPIVSEAADAEGVSSKNKPVPSERGVFEGKIFCIRAIANLHRSPWFGDPRSLRLEKGEDNDKEGYYSAPHFRRSQTPRKGFRFQFYSSVSTVGVLLNVLRSTGASRPRFRPALFLRALHSGATCPAAACCFCLLCFCPYLVCLVQTSPLLHRQHLGALCTSASHGLLLLLTSSSSLPPTQLSPLTFAAARDTFLSLSASVAWSCLLRGTLLGRGRGKDQLNRSNIHCVFSSLCYPVSDDVSVGSFASCSPPLPASSRDVTVSLFLIQFSTVVCVIPSRPSAASFCSLRYLLAIIFCSTLAPEKEGIVFIGLLPSLLCSTATFFVPCRLCTRGRTAAIWHVVLQFIPAGLFVILPPGDIRGAFLSVAIAVLPPVPQCSAVSPTALTTAAASRTPLAAAAGEVHAGAVTWYTVSVEYQAGLPRTRDAVHPSLAAACRCGGFVSLVTAAAAAGCTKMDEIREADLSVLFLCSTLSDVSKTERILSEWSSPSPPVAPSAAQERETRPMMCHYSQLRNRPFPLLTALISTAGYRLPLVSSAVFHVIFLCSWSRSPTARPFFLRSRFHSLPWWATHFPKSRHRCCGSLVSPRSLLLLLLLLLSWILSSAEFTVISDVDENIFLDLSGGLPEQQDSLLVRMVAGRKFSILNLDKQKYEIMPGAFRSEAFQILFDTVADKRNLTNPLACDRSLPRVRYSAYFIFASPLADFWEQLPAQPTPPPPPVTPGAVPTSSFDIYRFSWPRGYQAVSLGTGLCIQVVEKHINAKHILNVMFLASSVSSSSEQISPTGKVSLWTAVSLAVALLPLL